MQMTMQDSARYYELRTKFKKRSFNRLLFLVAGKLSVTPPPPNSYVFNSNCYQQVNMNGQCLYVAFET